MNKQPAMRHGRRVYDLLLARCKELGVCAWLCDAAGKVICRPGAPVNKDGAAAAALERDLSAAAIAAPAGEDLVLLPSGDWAVPLHFVNRGNRGPLIIVSVSQETSKQAASELAR